MAIEDFLVEYGLTFVGCFGVGWASGVFMLYFKKALDIIF